MRTPGDVVAHLPSIPIIIFLWVLGGVYALLGAMSLAETGVIVRRSGGQYPIVHRALGPYAGFVVGWTDWFSTLSSLALGAIVLGEFAYPLLPWMPGGEKAIGCTVMIAFGWLQWNGVRGGDIAQQILSGLKALAFAFLIVAGLAMAVPEAAVTAPAALPSGMGLLAGIVLSLQAIIFTYDGWTGPLYFGEETTNVERTMPRSMIIGVLLVMLIYISFNVAMLRVLGVEGMAGSSFVAGAAGAVLFGPKGDLVIRLIVIVAILGGLNATILFGARIPMAMSRDGLVPERLARVNAGGTPVVAHAATVIGTLVFVLSGTFNAVLAFSAFYFVANYTMSFVSVIALRRREPATPRPFTVPGYPVSTWLVLLGSLAFLVGSVISDRTNSLWSMALLAASYPVYRMTRRATPA